MKLTTNDILKIIQLIRINYDNAYSGYSSEEFAVLQSCWYESLKDYPKELVFESVKSLIEKNEFAPRLANIIDNIKQLQLANTPSDEQLWAELTEVLGKTYQISRYLAYPQYSEWTENELNKVYNGLSELLKLFVVNRSTLVEISEMTDESLVYERARFFKQMPALRKNYYDALDAKRLLSLTYDKGVTKIENKKI